jgi:hypothetical protein
LRWSILLLAASVAFAQPADDVFLFTYFIGNGEDGLHLAWSEDGYHWRALGGGRSFLAPRVGKDRLMRDPCVTRGPDGVYRLVWTSGWWDNGIGYASTKDFLTWSEQKFIPVMAQEPRVRNTWAPEVAWDAKRGRFLIFWASTVPGKFPTAAGASEDDLNHRIYCTTTKDWETFTPTRLFCEPGFNVIDATLLPLASRGEKYRLIVKDETLHPVAKHLRLAAADDIEGPWKEFGPAFTRDWVEGPTAIRVGGDVLVYFDCYREHRYGAVRSRGSKVSAKAETWEDVSEKISVPEGARHGTMIAVPRELVRRLEAVPASGPTWVSERGSPGDFPLVSTGRAAAIVVDPEDFKVVSIAAHDLAADIERVTGQKPELRESEKGLASPAVIIGTLGHSRLIDALAAAGKIDVAAVRGRWETFVIATASMLGEAASAAGAPRLRQVPALVIAGSDRRGTAFGVYELSQAIGVSPWHWWADVAPERKRELFVAAGTRKFGPPSVRYRGIFLNDEDWGLQPWAARTFAPEDGGIGPKTYAKVFELLLRLKANTLWPAMHKCTRPFYSFAADAPLADGYAIVIGSSHAEPMLRNNVSEWTAPAKDYDYVTNREGVRRYWEERVAATGRYESIYTIGMRGVHDSAMVGPKTDAERIATLEQIFSDQRAMLAKYVRPGGRAIANALSPESGVTAERRVRDNPPCLQSASAGVPQMFCAYKEVLGLYRAGLKVPDDVTIVWPDDNFGYVRQFATAEERKRRGGFGVYYHLSYLGAPLAYLWLSTTPPALVAEEMGKAYDHGARQIWIANVGDLKPAEIDTEFFLQMAWDIGQWGRGGEGAFLREWAAREFGAAQADEIAGIMQGCYRLNFQRRPEHLQWWRPRETPRASPFTAAETRARLEAFGGLVARVERVRAALPAGRQDAFEELVGYPVEASALANERYFAGETAALDGNGEAANRAWTADAELREKTRRFNEVVAGGKWNGILSLEPADGQWRSMRIAPWKQRRFAPRAAGEEAGVSAVAPEGFEGFLETGGVVAIEAAHYSSRGAGDGGATWERIPGLGRTADCVAVFPTTMPEATAMRETPRLDYKVCFAGGGEREVRVTVLPTHPIDRSGRLRLGVALDEAAPELLALDVNDGGPEWAQGVLDEARTLKGSLRVTSTGVHTLHVYGVMPGVLVEKIVIGDGGRSSYFGPAETYHSLHQISER